MSILQMDIPGARVLDLFAGSGALGLECLSRGASAADFVENDGRSLALLRKNIESLGADDKSTVHRADALRFAQGLAPASFDICVADPPYSGGYAETLVAHWLKHPFASILSVEHDARNKLEGGADTRRYGSSAITFYRTGD